MALLRGRTAELHGRVEAAVDIAGRTRTRGGYVALLGRLYGFYRTFEPRLESVPGIEGVGLDLGARRKVPLLEADLGHLGLTPGAIAALPACGDLPRPRTVAEGLGCLYVVEGSTLGGQFIRRQVEASLGLTGPGGGLAFFSSGGADVGGRWKAVREAIARGIATAEAEAEAVGMAVATFEAFGRWVASREGGGPACAPGGSAGR